MNLRLRYLLPLFAVAALAPRPAHASFHVMQIEQVIGGVSGHTDVQAIQLRMRASFQNQLQNGELIAHDAAGANPIVLISYPTTVTPTAGGTHILAATTGFQAATNTNLAPDFILTNPIPASYLPAGSLTFEDHFGTVYWRVSWGGAGFTGVGTGNTTNDLDGQFNPDFGAALPSATEQALLFKNAFSAGSTNNAADYAVTVGPATFTNSGGQTGTVQHLAGVPLGGAGSLALSAPSPNPAHGSMSYRIVLPREQHVQVRIVDLSGRLVRTLVNRSMGAGTWNLTWDGKRDGRQVSNGVYFLDLAAEGGRKTQRFVVAR